MVEKRFEKMTKKELVDYCASLFETRLESVNRCNDAAFTLKKIDECLLKNEVDKADELRRAYIDKYDSVFASERTVVDMFNEIAFGKILNGRAKKNK